jgi:hypothetical protein
VQEAQLKHNEGAADNLELYTSAIIRAALIAATDQIRKDKRQSNVDDDEAIKTALLIDDPILRLHAVTIDVGHSGIEQYSQRTLAYSVQHQGRSPFPF